MMLNLYCKIRFMIIKISRGTKIKIKPNLFWIKLSMRINFNRIVDYYYNNICIIYVDVMYLSLLLSLI